MSVDRPVLHCLVARELRDGSLSRTKIVPIWDALSLMHCGWFVVGPDPEDQEALAKWEREHRQPPTWWR